MTPDYALDQRVILVTGAAGGIGSEICRRLAAAGARLVLCDIQDEETIAAVMETLVGDDHMTITAAIDDSAALARVAEQVHARYGTLDVLINNAGVTRPVAHNDLEGLDDDLIDRIFRVNWRGAFACVRAFRRLLETDGCGTVVNISSIAGTTGIGSNVAYCASKAAMNAMTLSLARALAPAIRVVAIAPGWVLGEYAKRMDPALLDEQRELTPLNRLAQATDVAEAVYAVIAHLGFTTGAIIPVDGGRPLN